MITLSNAALLYNVNEQTILQWVEQYDIILAKEDDRWMLDDEAISKLFAQNIRWDSKVREREPAKAHQQIDDQIYRYKSFLKVDSFLCLLINELAMLIPNEEGRAVFVEVLSGEDLSEVAERREISFNKARHLYESALKIIDRNKGFLRNYRTKLANVELEARKLQIQDKNLREHINTLHAVLDDSRYVYKTNRRIMEQAEENIPWVTVRLLSLNLLTDVNLETRVANCLKKLGLVTVEDLLRYIKRGGGLKCLAKYRNFGTRSCEMLILELEKIGVMDSDGNSKLLKYIE